MDNKIKYLGDFGFFLQRPIVDFNKYFITQGKGTEEDSFLMRPSIGTLINI